MRLKILFAPLAFLIAIVVSIWYIWPGVEEIRLKNKDLADTKGKLADVLRKKENAETLRVALDKNKDKEDFILSFIPFSKNEEKIVSGINYLATSSSLVLSSISIEDKKEDLAAQAALPVDPSLAVTPDAANQRPEPKAKFSKVKTSLSGKYENVKIFLDQMHKMEMLGKISSLAITNESEEGAEGNLAVEIEADFGYLPEIKESGGSASPIFSQNNFNFDPYFKLSGMINKNIPSLDEGQKGAANPFLP